MATKIPFNKPFIVGKELYYVAQAVTFGNLGGDGHGAPGWTEVSMKFMVTWRAHPEKRQAVFSAFAQMTAEDDQKELGGKIKLIGRWHDLSEFTGVAICESDDAQAMASWALKWNSVLDVQTRVVLDDEEARAVGRQRLAEMDNIKTTVAQN